jgi:hypothetical protein
MKVKVLRFDFRPLRYIWCELFEWAQMWSVTRKSSIEMIYILMTFLHTSNLILFLIMTMLRIRIEMFFVGFVSFLD